MPRRSYGNTWNGMDVESRRRVLGEGYNVGGMTYKKAGMKDNPKDDDFKVKSKYQKTLKRKENKIISSPFESQSKPVKKSLSKGMKSRGWF